ncbi:hypothetical protein MOQ95_001513 [Salmonella enterica]|nr:hypothetical protein [Salmonella enterica]
MSLEKYLDSKGFDFIDAFIKSTDIFGDLQFNRFYDDYENSEFKKNLKNKGRREIKAMLRSVRNDTIKKDDKYFEDKTIAKVFLILQCYGFSSLAKDLAYIHDRHDINKRRQEIIYKEIAECAASKQRSVSASGPRHHLHDEIVAIIKATWAKNPALSKKKMIRKLSIRYEDRIDEGTLNSWIKKENLAPPPPPPGQHKNSSLVIPPEYA